MSIAEILADINAEEIALDVAYGQQNDIERGMDDVRWDGENFEECSYCGGAGCVNGCNCHHCHGTGCE